MNVKFAGNNLKFRSFAIFVICILQAVFHKQCVGNFNTHKQVTLEFLPLKFCVSATLFFPVQATRSTELRSSQTALFPHYVTWKLYSSFAASTIYDDSCLEPKYSSSRTQEHLKQQVRSRSAESAFSSGEFRLIVSVKDLPRCRWKSERTVGPEGSIFHL